MVCPEENAIFDCTRSDGTLIGWRVTSTCGSLDYETSFSSTNLVGHTRNVTLCSTALMFRVVSRSSSSISVTLTIHTPVQLNGSRISCRRQTVTLDVLSSKLNLVILSYFIDNLLFQNLESSGNADCKISGLQIFIKIMAAN